MLHRLVLLVGGLLLGGPARSQVAAPPQVPPAAARRLPVPATVTTSAAQPTSIAWGWVAPAPTGNPGAAAYLSRPAQPQVAYYDDQADARGRLLGLADQPNPVAQLLAARRRRPGIPVLLRLRYQEPATGPSLLGPGQEPARQHLADTLGQQLAATGADGLHLAVQLRPLGVPAAPATRPLRPGELAGLRRTLTRQRQLLNADSVKLGQDTTWLRAQLRAALPVTQRVHYQQLLQERRLRTVAFRQRRAGYRRRYRAMGKGLLLLAADSATGPLSTGNAPGLLRLLGLLRQKLKTYRPDAQLVVSLPLVDSTGQYAALARLAPVVDSFALPAPPDGPGPADQLRAAVRRYQAAGIPAGQLLVTGPHPGPPVQVARVAPPPHGQSAARQVDSGRRPGWTHLALFAAALVLGCACVGLLLGTLLRAPAIIPFRPRLLRIGALLGSALLLLLGYSYLQEPGAGQPLQYGCLAGLGLLGAGLLYHRYSQPAQLP